MPIFNLHAPELKQSLDETIVWCMDRQLSSTPEENDEIIRRREFMDQAGELMHQAMIESKSFGNRILRRDYTSLPKYKRGQELMSRANPASFPSFVNRLRSPELRPSPSLDEAKNREEQNLIVQSVVSRRAALVSKLMIGRATSAYRPEGRLLIYWPEENLSDGAAEYSSLGFFDTGNIPPWDTWVAYSQGALLSWVHSELCDIVGKGIAVNPEECIAWYL